MSEEIIIIFSPEGLRSLDDYKKKWAELDTISEFKPIKSRELAFAWYISNPTSYLCLQFPDKAERVLNASKKCFSDPKVAQKYSDDFNTRRLSNQSAIEAACRRFEKMLPTIRYRAQQMVNNIFSDIEELLGMDKSEFKNKLGEQDLNAYISVRTKALKELPEMVRLAEIGFGTADKEGVKISGQTMVGNYLKNKL